MSEKMSFIGKCWNSLNGYFQEKKCKKLIKRAISLNNNFVYDKATEIAEKSLEIAEKTFGNSHPILAEILEELDVIYSNQNRY